MKKTIYAILIMVTVYSAAAAADSFSSLIEEGDVYYNDKKYDQAEEYFSKAIAAEPGNAKGYWYRGDALFKKKNYIEAEKDYTKSIELDPSNPKVFNQRGSCFYNRDMFQ